jgi:PPOX class probable F420-dependent enzyme
VVTKTSTGRDERRQMTKLTDAQAAFLANPYYAVLATVRGDGSPHQTVVWVDTDDGDLLFNTAEGRAKPRYLRENPNVSATIVDPADGYHWVAVSGTAELTHEGADGHIDRLAKKYLDADSYPFRKEGEQRVTVRIHAKRIETAGFDGAH